MVQGRSRFILGYSFRVQFVMVGGHIGRSRKQLVAFLVLSGSRERCTLVLSFIPWFSSTMVLEMVPPAVTVWLPRNSLTNILRNWFPRKILDHIKLTVKINYHRRQAWTSLCSFFLVFLPPLFPNHLSSSLPLPQQLWRDYCEQCTHFLINKY